MESNLNEEKVTVQSLITSVPAASGGEQTGPQSSSSSACKEPISEVGNLASVIKKEPRNTEYENTVSTVQESLSNEDKTTKLTKINITNDSINVKDTKESIKEYTLQPLPKNNDGESKPSDPIKIESNCPLLAENNIRNHSIKKDEYSGGEQTGPQSSSSNACKEPISEAGNLASIIKKEPRSTEYENTVLTGHESLSNEDKTTKLTKIDVINDSINVNDTKESIKEYTLQPEPKNTDGESKPCDPIKIESNCPLLAENNIRSIKKDEDNKEIIQQNLLQHQQTENHKELVDNIPMQIKNNAPMLSETNNMNSITNTVSTTKRRLSGAQRRKAIKLRKLSNQQMESDQGSQKETDACKISTSEKSLTVTNQKIQTSNVECKQLSGTDETKPSTPMVKNIRQEHVIDNIKTEPVQQLSGAIKTKKDLGVIANKNITVMKTQGPLQKRLSGAGKKRMAFFVANGYSREEAKVLARKPTMFEKIRDKLIEQKARESKNEKSDTFSNKQSDQVPMDLAENENNRSTDSNPIEAEVDVHMAEKDALLASTANTLTDKPLNTDANEKNASIAAEKPRLCGAARRRLKMYMEKGMSSEEAMKLCLKPMREARNELLSYLTILGTTNNTKGFNTENPNDPNIGTRPTGIGTPAQVRNKRSPSLKQPLISQQKLVVGFFPNSLEDVTDKILSFIQWQNEGLNALEWKLLRRCNNNGNVMLKLLIDKLSAAKLEELRGEIFYKFRQIRLHLKDYDEKKL